MAGVQSNRCLAAGAEPGAAFTQMGFAGKSGMRRPEVRPPDLREQPVRSARTGLRIAHLVDYLMPQLGYQEFLLPKWNQRHGHEVHVVTSDRYKPVSDYDQTWGNLLGPRVLTPGCSVIEGVHIHRLPVTFELKARVWVVGLEETIRRIEPDVLFVHGTGSPLAFSAARIARRLGLPMLMDNHMVFSSRNRGLSGEIYYRLLRFFSPRLLGRATYRFLGVADECCQFLEREQGLDPSDIECLPLAVDTDLFRPKPEVREATRRQFGVPADAVVILQTGKLTPRKAPHLLAEAAAPLLRDDPNLRLVFVGGGEADYLAHVRAPFEAFGVTEQAHFAPLVPVKELAAVYSMADIGVYPGGTSLSCLEASACELPVIMTDLPASRWRAEHGVGMCYELDNVDDLQRRIARVLRDDSLRSDVARRSRRGVMEHFSYDAVARRSEELMADAIAARRNGRGSF
jgi:glycosyltransferase involved in cell wall biosynthesis